MASSTQSLSWRLLLAMMPKKISRPVWDHHQWLMVSYRCPCLRLGWGCWWRTLGGPLWGTASSRSPPASPELPHRSQSSKGWAPSSPKILRPSCHQKRTCSDHDQLRQTFSNTSISSILCSTSFKHWMSRCSHNLLLHPHSSLLPLKGSHYESMLLWTTCKILSHKVSNSQRLELTVA